MSGAVLCAAVQNGDVDPDAMNWANISGGINGDRANADQTISGLSRPIQISLNWSASGFLLLASFYYVKNGAAKVLISNGIGFGPFVNTDTLHFVINGSAPGTPATITVQNATLGTGSLDSFTVTLT